MTHGVSADPPALPPGFLVDPRHTRSDRSGRFPPSFLRFPWYMALANQAGRLPFVRDHRLFSVEATLLPLFDSGAPGPAFGPAEGTAALRQLLIEYARALDGNPMVSPIGRMLIARMARGHMLNRARTLAFHAENAAFIAQNGKIAAPLIVTGFPRTGTTLLQRLLAEDPLARAPYTFELERTTPPRRAGDDPMADPRIGMSERALARLERAAPGLVARFAQSHPYSPTEPEESLLSMQLHNGLQFLSGPLAGREYHLALHRPGPAATALLAYERQVLSMMHAWLPAPSHWTLKAPAYAPLIGDLFSAYPDARVVLTHRHPGRNFASVCRLLETSVLPFVRPGSFDKWRFAAFLSETMAPFLTAPIAWRAANPDRAGQLLDVDYQSLVSDPIAAVRRIYAHFSLDYTPAFEARMQAWLSANPQGRAGRHAYSNAEYGIDPAALAERFAPYYARQGYKAEPGAAD